MVIEAIVIAFFAFWLANEYFYNVYFRIYVNGAFVQNLTTYTIALGLGIGLAGTAAAAALYKNLREAKVKLESVAPRIRGSVEKILGSVSTMEGKSTTPPINPATVSQLAPESQGTTAVAVPQISPSPPPQEKN
jgi:hypothetical protein